MNGIFAWSPAFASALILACTLLLFASGKLRHDLVALLSLAVCIVIGLVPREEAFSGFSDPSVIVIVAVLIVGRAVELTGAADALTDRLASLKAPFAIQLAILLVAGAALSAFMNNIAALAITMPAVISICRAHNMPPSAGLMPLSFATILGGMTTLIGTPANLILSSVREQQIGAPFGFFAMTPVAAAVALAGVAYICLIGWRLVPRRNQEGDDGQTRLYSVFELGPLGGDENAPDVGGKAIDALKAARGAVLGIVRGARVLETQKARPLHPQDRLLVGSMSDPWEIARKTGLAVQGHRADGQEEVSVAAVVGHGSPLIGRPFDTVKSDTNGEVAVIAAGARVIAMREPISRLRVEAGDQITMHGKPETIAYYSRYARLLEVARRPVSSFDRGRALFVVGVYAAAVVASAVIGISTAFTFATAAVVLAALRFLPSKEIYSSVDWSVIVLIGAMIPIGRSFETSGAAAVAGEQLSLLLGNASLFWAAAGVTTVTMLLSIFLNNVATAIIMGQIGLIIAQAIGAPPDAMLIAVLIGASSDFLTPIGHQNNLLVMGPGGYRFTDYIRVGAPLSAIVVFTTAKMIELLFQ